MIKISQLNYTYPNAKTQTLFDLEFEISKAEIVGCLGPSGAGKSTLQNILIGMLKNYHGNIEIMGKNLNAWGQDFYQHIGVSFELPNHFLKLSGRENLEHFGALYAGDKNTAMEVLSWVGLSDDADKKVSDFSKGMKIRLNVARALIHKPKILFLDEPTSGLDPVNAARIRDLIFKLRDQGTTVFITTHNMTLAEQLCDRVAFITNGKLQAIGTPAAFKKQYGRRFVAVKYLDNNHAKTVEFPMEDLGGNLDFINLLNSNAQIDTIHSEETTLEDVFIKVTGQELTL